MTEETTKAYIEKQKNCEHEYKISREEADERMLVRVCIKCGLAEESNQ